jgi:hypothetical protein
MFDLGQTLGEQRSKVDVSGIPLATLQRRTGPFAELLRRNGFVASKIKTLATYSKRASADHGYVWPPSPQCSG